LPPRFYNRERDAYKDSLTPGNPDQVAMEEVNHREYLRKVGGGGAGKIRLQANIGCGQPAGMYVGAGLGKSIGCRGWCWVN